MGSVILVTGFEPFGPYPANPSEELAKAVDGRLVAGATVRSLVLPVHHARAGRARLALERVAVNVMDYELPDNAGYRATGEPCVPGGPAAYFSTLPLGAILAELTAEGIPAYISNTAGTYVCNQTLYTTLHAIREGSASRAGLIHVPLLPAVVAASRSDDPSMDFALLLRALEVSLGVLARGDGADG